MSSIIYQIKELIGLCILIGLGIYLWEVVELGLEKFKNKMIKLLRGIKD